MIEITPFTEAHIPAALGLSQAVSWPHQHGDWAMALGLSTGVAAMDEGHLVGTAFRSDFGAQVATANMIIVAQSHQGQGLGRRLMEATHAPDRAIRLVATPAGLPLYRRLGYVEAGQILRHQGRVSEQISNPGLSEADASEFTQITALESASFGGDRRALIDRLHKVARFFVARSASGAVSGYAALRPFGPGFLVGPVCAPDREMAQALILSAAAQVPGRLLRIDTDAGLGLSPWLDGLGIEDVGGGTLMQCGGDAPPPMRYGLSSQALG